MYPREINFQQFNIHRQDSLKYIIDDCLKNRKPDFDDRNIRDIKSELFNLPFGNDYLVIRFNYMEESKLTSYKITIFDSGYTYIRQIEADRVIINNLQTYFTKYME